MSGKEMLKAYFQTMFKFMTIGTPVEIKFLSAMVVNLMNK